MLRKKKKKKKKKPRWNNVKSKPALPLFHRQGCCSLPVKVVCAEDEVGAVCRSGYHFARCLRKKTPRKPTLNFHQNYRKKPQLRMQRLPLQPRVITLQCRSKQHQKSHLCLRKKRVRRKSSWRSRIPCGCGSMRCDTQNSPHLVKALHAHITHTTAT